MFVISDASTALTGSYSVDLNPEYFPGDSGVSFTPAFIST